MRIAIIGGGISGLVVGHKLSRTHQITLFEANDYVGGHTNTVDVETDQGQFAVDTGFIVFNDRTYPNFIELLNELGVASQPTGMSFSVSCEKTGLEYRGADFGGLFAQRRNLLNPGFLRMLWELIRFRKLGESLLESDHEDETVGHFLERHQFSDKFVHQYFLPMGAAIWSAPFASFRQFPIRFIAEFYKNHGLLGISDRPQWRVIVGGSRSYVEPLTRDWAAGIRLQSTIESVVRESNGVSVKPAGKPAESFDHVVFACHSDQALAILGHGATATESEILGAFPYQRNVAVLHTQKSVLPRNRRAWACWNYFQPAVESDAATVTYNMNLLQSLDSNDVFCVTLNDTGRIEAENIIKTIDYWHPTFNVQRKQMQMRHKELINQNLTSFCGAYWGNGFHEDGVKSAIAVSQTLSALTEAVGC